MDKRLKLPLITGIILWSAVFWWLYYSRFPVHRGWNFQALFESLSGRGWNLAPVLFPLLMGILILFIAHFLGTRIMQFLKISVIQEKGSWCLSCLLGLFALGLITYLLGILGLLYRWIFWLLTILLLIPTLIERIPQIRGFKKISFPRDKLVLAVWIVLILLGSVCLMYTLTPPIQSDGLRYHLAAPQEYIKKHAIGYIPFSALSNSPFLIEMLFVYGMLAAGDLLAKLLHLCLWFLCLYVIKFFIIHFWGKRETKASPKPEGIANLCGLFFLSIPAAAIVASWSFIDLGISVYFLGFILCLGLYIQNREKGSLILCGIFGGAALGTKYTMLPMVLLGCLMAGALEYIQPSPARAKKKALFVFVVMGLIAISLALPWYGKNLISTGNPFYPLAYRIFGGSDWSPENATFYASKAAGKGFGKSLRFLISSPYDSTMKWHRFGMFNPGPGFLYLVPLIILGLFIFKEKQNRKVFGLVYLFSAAYYLMWFFGYQSNRFLLPFYGLMAIITGRLLVWLSRKSPVVSQLVVVGLSVCILFSSAWTARWILTETKPPPLGVFLGTQSRNDYLTQALDYYPGIRATNELVPPEQAILCIGEHRGYYFKPRLLISDWFDTPVILDLIRNTPDNTDLFRLLNQAGCTHVFYNKGELSKYHDMFFQPRFKQKEYRRFEDFLDSPNLELRYRIKDVFILKIK